VGWWWGGLKAALSIIESASKERKENSSESTILGKAAFHRRWDTNPLSEEFLVTLAGSFSRFTLLEKQKSE
jgi:hypothetical protein